jgi:hypothetical protein
MTPFVVLAQLCPHNSAQRKLFAGMIKTGHTLFHKIIGMLKIANAIYNISGEIKIGIFQLPMLKESRPSIPQWLRH